MRNFAVCCLLLALAALAPVSGEGGRFDVAWGLGLLMLLAYAAQQIAAGLRLPALVGWIAAGLVLGQSGLKAVRPTAVDSLHLILLFAAIWVGFQVGLGLVFPGPRRRRLAGVVALSTAVAFLLTSVGVNTLGEQPWSLALPVGALTCLWGPCILSFLSDDDELKFISVIGAGTALILLTGTVVLLHRGGPSFGPAVWTAASPWVSLAAGLGVAELLWRLGIFSRRSTAVAGSVGTFLLIAAVLGEFRLYALPFGFACGALLSWREGSSDTLRHLLEPARPMAAMVFFALLGASLDVGGALSPPHPSLYLIVLIQLFVLILLRGVGPAVWFPLSAAEDSKFARYTSWLLLPGGAVLFELVYLPRAGALPLLSDFSKGLLYQLVVLDLLLYGLVFPAVANGVVKLFRAPSPDDAVADAPSPARVSATENHSG
ncbi:MAG: hypothetical protein CME15_07865 [Gemmatimonadetes bacterium]|jgi:hypothetical protein|nr:hypothetical protein [Gemmatimonadota bacterium]